jgi:3-oxoacid CoA-transferase
MDKVVASAKEALADMKDGASVALAGFGLGHRFPNTLIRELRERGTKELTLVCNSLGNAGEKGQMLVENNQVAKIQVAFSVRPNIMTAAEERILAGKLDVELVPQGILVERCRAGGAGIPAFWSPTAADTDLADGKEVRYFNGRKHVLEHAIHLDYALLSGYRADRAGNVQFRGGARNFNPSFAKAARVAIIEVDEIVETGELPPELIDLPGIFIDRVIKNEIHIDARTLTRSGKRPADTARTYLGKKAVTRAAISKNAAKILRDESYVNLGTGIPTEVSNFIAGRGIWLHAENGVLGYGGTVTGDAIDPDVYNAGGQFVQAIKGTSFFDSVTSFEMARGGHIDTVILGAYEVDEEGNVANWSTSDARRGGIGGAMDLVAGDCELIIVLEHRDSKDRPKLRKRCKLPLTARRRANWVVTDLAVFHLVDGGYVLEAMAPGFTVEEIRSLTEMEFKVAPNVAVMETT